MEVCGCPLQSFGDYGVGHTLYDRGVELGRFYMCPTSTPVGHVLSQHLLEQNKANLEMIDHTRDIMERLKQEVFGESVMDKMATGVCWLVHGRRCSCTGLFDDIPKGLFYFMNNTLFLNANTEDAYRACPDVWLQDVYECIAFALARIKTVGASPH